MMFKKGYLFLLAVLMITSVSGTVLAGTYVPIAERGYAHPESLISCEELKDLLENDDVVIVDNRTKAKYLVGYIPGAINIERSAMQADGGLRLTKEVFEELFSEAGIDNDDLVVVYDDQGGLYSAWLWWLAKMYGHENIKILDGGINRWKELGYDTKKVFGTNRERTNYVAKELDGSWLATVEDVKKAIDDENTVILDTRTKEEYLGEKLLSGASRKGRIPGCVWLEWNNAINEGDSTFKTAAELKALYEEVGVTPDKAIIPYCQSAVRASHTTFVLTQLLGFEKVSNYDGSWIEWSGNENLPIETGE